MNRLVFRFQLNGYYHHNMRQCHANTNDFPYQSFPHTDSPSSWNITLRSQYDNIYLNKVLHFTQQLASNHRVI